MLTRSMAKVSFLCALAFATAVYAAPAFSADATLHEVYQAANSGRMQDAENMMAQVLRDHPDSAKAHYVAAEVHARAGRRGDARQELAAAERIDPKLSFAQARAVNELRAELRADGGVNRAAGYAGFASEPRRSFSGIGWLVLIGAGILIWMLFRRRRAANAAQYVSAVQPGAAPMGTAGYPGGVAPPPGGYGYGGGVGAGGGLGSALASGLAVGAGVVAGEQLMRHFTEGDRHAGLGADANQLDPPQNADMGGSDFGVSDAGSWDDGGSSFDGGGGGGGDWS